MEFLKCQDVHWKGPEKWNKPDMNEWMNALFNEDIRLAWELVYRYST